MATCPSPPLHRGKKRARPIAIDNEYNSDSDASIVIPNKHHNVVIDSDSSTDFEIIAPPPRNNLKNEIRVNKKAVYTCSRSIKREFNPNPQSWLNNEREVYVVDSDSDSMEENITVQVALMGEVDGKFKAPTSGGVQKSNGPFKTDESSVSIESPLPMVQPQPLITPRNHSIIVRVLKRTLQPEHFSLVLSLADREQPTSRVVQQITELITRGVGPRTLLSDRWIRYLLVKKLNSAVDRGIAEETCKWSEWMKILHSIESSRQQYQRVSKHRPRTALLRRPVRLTIRSMQSEESFSSPISARKSKSRTSIPSISRSIPSLENTMYSDRYIESNRRGVVRSPTSNKMRKFKNATKPARSAQRQHEPNKSSSTPTSSSPPSTSREDVLSRPERLKPKLLLNIVSDKPTTGVNASMPIGWTLESKDLINGLRPVSMNPLFTMSLDELNAHISSVRCQGRMKSAEKLMDILTKLMTHPRNRHGVFNVPVDPVALNLPTYRDIIQHPMDLGTVKQRLTEGQYINAELFCADVQLVFENAKAFNPPKHYIHVDADVLLGRFHEMMRGDGDRHSKRHLESDQHACDVCMGKTCALCEQGCQPFAQPHLQCAAGCGTDIRKGSIYFVTRDGTRVWCNKCRNRMLRVLERDGGLENNMNGTPKESSCIKKKKWTEDAPIDVKMVNQLVRKRCDVSVEPWVQCSKCLQWLHQVCGLYNPVFGAYTSVNEYLCPHCVWCHRSSSPTPGSRNKPAFLALLNPEIPPQSYQSTSMDIPKCEIAVFIERFLRNGLYEMYNDDAIADSLHVRVLSFPQECVTVPSPLVKTFEENAKIVEETIPQPEGKAHRFPPTIPYTSRGIYLYQRLDGCDICLFTLFVQEYGDHCTLPSNRRSVYIAYLDSIRYLKPAHARTNAYHFLMMAYFDYVRRHGFERVFIWSCPPQKRISYVFWCRPPFQKTPSADHLRSWYRRLLMKSQEAKIVSQWSTMYDRYFITDPTVLLDTVNVDQSNGVRATRHATARSVDPYEHVWPIQNLPPIFEGDFVVAELERILGRLDARNANTISNCMDGVAKQCVKVDESLSVDIKLNEVFTKCQQAVQRLKNDLLVVDLNVVVENSEKNVSTETQSLCTPETLIPSWWQQVPRFFGSRFMFHQLCATAGYQFDSLRRAKHSTMMMFHHLFNERVCQMNVFCHECCFLITNVKLWHCQQCELFAICDSCCEQEKTSDLVNLTIEKSNQERRVNSHEHPVVFGVRNT